MADNLKQYYRDIEANPPELAGYRARLRERLPADRGWFRPWHVFAAAAVLTAALVWLFLPTSGFPQKNLGELQSLTANGHHEKLVNEAQRLLNGKSGIRDRLNALMVLCLIEKDGKTAVHAAARGLLSDPRPEFRSYYLELLLDQADEYQYNIPLIEDRMDQETDKLCLRLYKQLLHIASS